MQIYELSGLKTGVAITDLGLNDFRMDLLNYLKDHGDLANVPNGLHAVVPADPMRGLPPGIIFTLRNRNPGFDHSINNLQHNRLHPWYLVYIGNDGSVIADHSEVKRLLDLSRAACKGHSEPVTRVCRLFNQATRDGRDMQACSALLDQAIHSMIERRQQSDIDSLFTADRTSALVDTIAGLDDFELITFLVIQDSERDSGQGGSV